MKTILRSKVDLVTVVFCVLMLIATVSAIGPVQREFSFRKMCSEHLRVLGIGLIMYSEEYATKLPDPILGANSQWTQEIQDWTGTLPSGPFKPIDQNTSEATVTSYLYLLYKTRSVFSLDSFTCPSDVTAHPLTLAEITEHPSVDFKLRNAWDFGPWIDESHNASSHCSYAYLNPFAKKMSFRFRSTVSILADRNPWINPERAQDPNVGFDRFSQSIINDKKARVWLGNSSTHLLDGQNIFYSDGHVNFASQALNRTNDDNIYTIIDSNGSYGRIIGNPPTPYVNPSTFAPDDEILIQDR